MGEQPSDGSVKGARRVDQRGRGGSIPAPSLFVQFGRDDEARELIKRFHYSRRWPGNVQLVATLHRKGGLFGDSGEAVAACCLSIPPTRWSEDVWELSRLVRRDDCRPPLTMLIRFVVRRAKRHGADLLVSFADKTHGHNGGVYRAAGWDYAGCRKRQMDGVIIEGRFVPGRSCNSAWGTRSPERLADKLGLPVAPHFDEGKHCYFKALGRRGKAKAARLGLEAMDGRRLKQPKESTR